jgi:hypothetical protein
MFNAFMFGFLKMADYSRWELIGSPVQRADNTPAALVKHVGVDHRRGNIGMSEQLLCF